MNIACMIGCSMAHNNWDMESSSGSKANKVISRTKEKCSTNTNYFDYQLFIIYGTSGLVQLRIVSQKRLKPTLNTMVGVICGHNWPRSLKWSQTVTTTSAYINMFKFNHIGAVLKVRKNMFFNRCQKLGIFIFINVCMFFNISFQPYLK